MVLVQKWSVFQLSFLANIEQENVFYDIIERKKSLPWLKKHEVQKFEKTDIFLKWLTHGFGPKMALFPTFCFRQ